ncbi:GDSL-type esterase/lipase family protein [Burkholderia cenocepacia]|uniref:GDSL-type esterase/lipase family protein n=1 Tax=Burkholderia cenocepacia TaxID=95486 RepID=UPI00338E14FC
MGDRTGRRSGPAHASVAAIGDSITDGLRSSVNRNRRWPDALARRLAAAGADSVGVVNLGISGNRCSRFRVLRHVAGVAVRA